MATQIILIPEGEIEFEETPDVLTFRDVEYNIPSIVINKSVSIDEAVEDTGILEEDDLFDDNGSVLLIDVDATNVNFYFHVPIDSSDDASSWELRSHTVAPTSSGDPTSLGTLVASGTGSANSVIDYTWTSVTADLWIWVVYAGAIAYGSTDAEVRVEMTTTGTDAHASLTDDQAYQLQNLNPTGITFALTDNQSGGIGPHDGHYIGPYEYFNFTKKSGEYTWVRSEFKGRVALTEGSH